MSVISGSINKYFKGKTDNLKTLSIRSAIWSLLGKGGGDAIRIAGNLILTRILFPEVFGLLATANVVLVMVQLFADTGVKTAIIQNPRGEETRFLDTVWLISIVRGLILCIIISALAWPLSIFYNEPQLKYILLIMGTGPLLLGFENPALPLLIRKFRVEKQIKMEILTQLISLVTTIVLAVILQSAYALAFGYTIASFYRIFASFFIVPYRPRFKWDKEAGKELFDFGKFIFLNTLITVAVYQMDVIVIGKVLNMESLSFYNIGKNLGIVVFTFFNHIISQSILPAISSVQTDISHVQRIYRRTMNFVLTLGIPVSVVIMLFSYEIIELLYDPRYQLAYISMAWFSMAGIFRIIGKVSGTTFFALGKPVQETKSMAAGLIIIVIAILLGVNSGGLFGASCGVAIAVSLIPLIESFLLIRAVKFSIKTAMAPYFHTLFVGGACIAVYFLSKSWFPERLDFKIAYILFMGVISMIISGLVFLYLEGPNPFGDRGGSKSLS